MKPFVTIFLCVLAGALLFGCAKKPAAPVENGPAVTFRSGLPTDADVWILPETEEILHTTVWGSATLRKTSPDVERPVALAAPGPAGLYVLRAIDTNGMYYAADEIALTDGDILRLSVRDLQAVLTVEHANGAPADEYDVFSAAL